jgi:hypothetical protein
MISLAGQTMRTAVVSDDGRRNYRGWIYWRIIACAAMLAGARDKAAVEEVVE